MLVRLTRNSCGSLFDEGNSRVSVLCKLGLHGPELLPALGNTSLELSLTAGIRLLALSSESRQNYVKFLRILSRIHGLTVEVLHRQLRDFYSLLPWLQREWVG